VVVAGSSCAGVGRKKPVEKRLRYKTQAVSIVVRRDKPPLDSEQPKGYLADP
jgi:hypothetical protein